MDLEKYYTNPFFTLYDKQKEIIKKALLSQFGLILGEQGVGKTLISVYLAKIWFELNCIQHLLIITKNEIKSKYKEELLKHLPFLLPTDISVFHKNDRDFFKRKKKIHIADYNNIKMAYYHLCPKVKGEKKSHIKNVFGLDKGWGVFFDEIQYVKSIKSDTHKVLFKNTEEVNAVIGLSGTPVEKIEEIFAVFRVINPGIIQYNYHTFMNSIAELQVGTYQVLYYRQKGMDAVWKKVNPFIFRISKNDIKTMVTKVETNLEVIMEKDYEMEYNLFVRSIKQSIKEPLFRNGKIVRRTLAGLIPKIYNYIKKVDLNNPRFRRFNGFVQRVVINEKLIVWDNSPDTLNALSGFYTKLGIGNLVIHGGIPIPDRVGIIKRFDEDPSIRLFFISVLSTKDAWEIPSRPDIKRCIYYSFPVSAINYSQSTDRIYRINSSENVSVYRMYMRETIDEWGKDLLEYKLKLQAGIISAAEFEKIEYESCERFFAKSLL